LSRNSGEGGEAGAHLFSALSSGKYDDPKRAQTAQSVNAYEQSRAEWVWGFANSPFCLCGLCALGGSKHMQATEVTEATEVMEKNGSNPNEGVF
jgi:hypothetical protein